MHCQWSVCVACGLEMLPALCATVPATVSDSFPLLRCSDVIVWVNFGWLFALGVSISHFLPRLTSDGSGSHCKMMSENPGQFNTFTPHVTTNVSVATFVSTTVDVPYQNDFTYVLKNFQSVGRCRVFQNQITALNNGKFAAFGDTLDSFVRFRLCFAFDARCAPRFEWDVCQLMFYFLRLGKRTWYGDWLRSCLDKNSIIVYWILNNWLDDCVRNMGIVQSLQSLSLYT